LGTVAVGTDPVQDIIAGIGLVILWQQYRTSRIQKQTVTKIDTAATKVEEVHALVDGQLTEVSKQRDRLQSEKDGRSS